MVARSIAGAQYEDTGCEFSPTCLSCTLPKCKYDMTVAEFRSIPRLLRDRQIAAAYAAGEGVTSLRRRYKLSARSIYRIIDKGRS